MSPGTQLRFRRDPQKSSSYIYRWKCLLTPAVIKINPGGWRTWWRLAKMKNKRNRSVRWQMCKRSWKLTLEAQNQQRPVRWGTPNCKSGFTPCSRGLWGQASSTIMLSLGWLSSSPSDCPLFRQQMVMMMVLTIIDGDVDNGVVDGAPVSLTIMFCSPACHPSVLCANNRRWIGYSEIGQNDYNIQKS